MNAMVRVAIVCLALVPTLLSAQGSSGRPSIYIGPQVRDGFADMDSGIRDSMRDLRQEFYGSQFVVARTREDATLTLIVLGRGVVTNGSVGFGSSTAFSGFGLVVPNEKPTLSTVLQIAKYSRTMQSEGPTWTGAAKKVVEDVEAWWEANRAAVEARARGQSN